jgi:hypothetical protein
MRLRQLLFVFLAFGTLNNLHAQAIGRTGKIVPTISLQQATDILNNTSKISIPTGGIEGQVLTIVGGIPLWTDPIKLVTFYRDTDGDGYGNNDEQLIVLSGSSVPNGFVVNSTDCNDDAPLMNPDTVWYLDADNDNYAVSTTTQCAIPGAGYTQTVLSLGDCNDSDVTINPATVWYLDADGDNYAVSTTTQCANPGAGYTVTILPLSDCNDTDESINPEVIEVPYDGIDNDCNTATLDDDLDGDGFVNANDCNDSDATINPATVWYLDADGDNYAISTKTQCANPGAGYTITVLPLSDCNDTDGSINPGIIEVPYDGIDNDCNLATLGDDLDGDGFVNADDCNDNDASVSSKITYYVDADKDGFGATATADLCSATAPAGYATNNTDCNDTNAAVHPEVIEVPYDGIDNDCNAATLDDDLDEDGFVNANDCNDNDATVSSKITYYVDADKDGFGATATADLCSATAPAGYATNNTDCNDTVESINPGSIEDLENGIDDDCDGKIDEVDIGDLIHGGIVFWVDPNDNFKGKVCDIQDAPNAKTWDNAKTYCTELTVTRNAVLYDDWYLPSIADLNLMYANKTAINTTALSNGGSSFADFTYWSSSEFDNWGASILSLANGNQSHNVNKGDTGRVRAVRAFCNATNPSINSATVWYLDADNDNYAISTTTQCANPGVGYTITVLPLGDCNDNYAAINPGVLEVSANGIDDDCDGQVDEATVGDLRDGGIVFWVDPADNTKGKVCALEEVSKNSAGAIFYSNDYTNSDTGTGVYSNWYLPSKEELQLMYANLQRFGCSTNTPADTDSGLCATRKGDFLGSYYWSSTEHSNGFTWFQHFADGLQYMHYNYQTLNVRPVRAF